MKNKALIILIACLLICNVSFPWGEKGHSLINKKGVEFLPKEMNGLKKWADTIAVHASDPDYRKSADSTEFPKHFIDIDFYKEYVAGKMVEDKAALTSIYSDSTVKKMGLLPWATVETLNNLTKAFKEKNVDKILLYTSDLGHYVGDGHQPMHTIMNYNGQLSEQKGIHAKYEIDMVDRHIEQLDSAIKVPAVKYIKNPLDYIFNYISNTNSVADVLFAADKSGFNITKERESEEYFRLLWYKTGYITKIQFSNAVEDLSSLIYTAWVNAGKPTIMK